MYVEEIFPLLMSKEVPPVIHNASLIGPDEVERVLGDIERKAMRFLNDYVAIYGDTVTTYLHIVGKHLRKVIEVGDHTPGAWSQVFAVSLYYI